MLSSTAASSTAAKPIGSVDFAGSTAVVRFPYSPDLVQAIKNAPDGCRFSKPQRAWHVTVTADNLRFLGRLGFGDFTGEIARLERPLRLLDVGEMSSIVAESVASAKTKPFAHQVRGLQLCLANDELGLFWEQGAGKTLTAIMALVARMKAGQVSRCLIICPKCVVLSWLNEFLKHTGLEVSALIRKNGDPLTKDKRIDVIRSASILVAHYEGVIFTPELMLEKWDMVVLDESHYIKTASAKRSKLIHRLCAAIKFRILMSGTPITGGPEDIYSQFMALDSGKTFGISFYAFRARYFVNNGWGDIPDWQIRPGALAELREKMGKKTDRVLKKDCFDLPPKNYQTVYVDMTPEQARAYRQMEREFMVEFLDRLGPDGQPSSIEVNYLITKMMKLNQITSGFVYDHDETGADLVYSLESNRLKILRELIEDKPKAVVWCLFRHDINAVMAAFPEMHPVETKDWQRFQEDPETRLIVGQVHAGGIGITLTAASFVVYYSQGYSLADRLQNEDRTHRIGTTGTVTYVDLVCPGTIDEEILDAIARKREMAGALLGESVAVDILAKMRDKALQRAPK